MKNLFVIKKRKSENYKKKRNVKIQLVSERKEK